MMATQDKTSTDRIEKRVQLHVPQSRVWRAISNAEEFGKWFGVTFDGAFAEGGTVRGRMPRKDAEDLTLEMVVERIQPEGLFSYRWHPYPFDTSIDYSVEPMTLVEFLLEPLDGGTQLTIVESGFDGILAGRRAEAFRMHEDGWVTQMKRVEQYVIAR